eukprot:48665-Amphidinium_carterae.1
MPPIQIGKVLQCLFPRDCCLYAWLLEQCLGMGIEGLGRCTAMPTKACKCCSTDGQPQSKESKVPCDFHSVRSRSAKKRQLRKDCMTKTEDTRRRIHGRGSNIFRVDVCHLVRGASSLKRNS